MSVLLYGTICAVKISRELLVLEFDKKKSKNKELLELGLERGSIYKKCEVQKEAT